VVVDSEMRGYYDDRAGEYDDWWLGTGLFASRKRPGWQDEVDHLVALVASLPPGRVLDVACGTGFLTRHLRGDVVALDQSPRMVEIAGARLPHGRAVQGDAVPLPFADGAFDRITTSHFYGHLLPEERSAFLTEAHRVGHQLIIIDSAKRPDTDDEEWQDRKLNNGSHHQIYKRFFTTQALVEELGGGEILHDGHWFVVVTTNA
jgi:ubiquinone/menaquinone biosynthesis C-methylase UbiE